MPLYDVLVEGIKTAQVKCFSCEMATYRPGNEVPVLDGRASYNIALREGGFAQVQDGVFLGIQEKPLAGEPICDKYGDWHTTDSIKDFYGSGADPFSVALLKALVEKNEDA